MARQISTAEAFFPRWRTDGKEIFYSSRRRLMAASVTLTKTSVKVGEERELIDPGQSLTGYDVSPDVAVCLKAAARASCLPADNGGAELGVYADKVRAFKSGDAARTPCCVVCSLD